MSDSVGPHRWQPTRLPCPWNSQGKNTGMGCHFLLQCMRVKSESEVAQSCPTLRDPMDCSLPGSSVHGIFQARVRLLLNHTVATQDSGISRPDSSLLCTHISPVCPSPGPSHHQCVHAWFSRGWQRVSLWRREREAGGPLFRDLHLPFCPSR